MSESNGHNSLTDEEVELLLKDLDEATEPIPDTAQAPTQLRVPSRRGPSGRNVNKLLLAAITKVKLGRQIKVDHLLNIARTQDDTMTRIELVQHATYATRKTRKVFCEDCADSMTAECRESGHNLRHPTELYLSITDGKGKHGYVTAYAHVDPRTTRGQEIIGKHVFQRQDLAGANAYHAGVIKKISES